MRSLLGFETPRTSGFNINKNGWVAYGASPEAVQPLIQTRIDTSLTKLEILYTSDSSIIFRISYFQIKIVEMAENKEKWCFPTRHNLELFDQPGVNSAPRFDPFWPWRSVLELKLLVVMIKACTCIASIVMYIISSVPCLPWSRDCST